VARAIDLTIMHPTTTDDTAATGPNSGTKQQTINRLTADAAAGCLRSAHRHGQAWAHVGVADTSTTRRTADDKTKNLEPTSPT
jgi:hypothetical protein